MVISEQERQLVRKEALAWIGRLGRIEEDRNLRIDIPWRPHLYCPKLNLAVHILLYAGIDRSLIDAFKLAKQKLNRLRIVIVGPIQFIQTSTVLELGFSVNTEFVALEDKDGLIKPAEYRDTLTLIHQARLVLQKETYLRLGATALDRLLLTSGQEKGRRLECFIAFLLSQIQGFYVHSTNYNTATEEIDIVVKNGRVGGFFSVYQEPLILVECKNQEKRAGKNEYVSFATKLRNRRRAASIGFFVSMKGYTQDFKMESLRDSRERLVIAKLDQKHVRKWSESFGEAAVNFLERLLEEAVLD